jgi:chromosome segregation ATPase
MGEEEKPPAWAEKLLDASKVHGEQLDEYGDNLEELTQSVGDLKGQTEVSLTRIGTELGHLKDRATEDRDRTEKRIEADRKRADKKEAEIEAKVGKAHEKNQQTDAALGKLEGEVENHMGDEHATTAAHTSEKLNAHIDDNNRHGGEAPGKSGAVKTAGIGVAGGGIVWGLIELAKTVFAGS